MSDGGQPLDESTANQLKSTVDIELAMKGLQKTERAQADLFIGYQAAFREERPITVYETGWSYGPGWRAGGIATTQTVTISIGSVVLDMYLPSQKLLIWRGTVSKNYPRWPVKTGHVWPLENRP